MKSVKQLILLPVYFLKGLLLFSKSYGDLIKAWEENEKTYKQIGQVKMNPDVVTGFISENRNTSLRLIMEHEKMFSQLFSIFIAFTALVVSVVALLLNICR